MGPMPTPFPKRGECIQQRLINALGYDPESLVGKLWLNRHTVVCSARARQTARTDLTLQPRHAPARDLVYRPPEMKTYRAPEMRTDRRPGIRTETLGKRFGAGRCTAGGETRQIPQPAPGRAILVPPRTPHHRGAWKCAFWGLHHTDQSSYERSTTMCAATH